MPRVNIYIRNEDWEAWQSIEDKPEFIHDAIQLKEMYKMKKLPVYFINPGPRGHEKIGTDLHPSTAARIVEADVPLTPGLRYLAEEEVRTEPEETA
jgi:hypothetical protein